MARKYRTEENANEEALSNMVWAKDGTAPQWYGRGKAIEGKQSIDSMLKAAGLDWEVEKRPVYRKVGDSFTPLDNKFELVRKTDDQFLSMAGSGYRPVQNKQSMAFFKGFSDEAGVSLEAAGDYWNGRYIWALARIGKDFNVGGKNTDDKVQNYILMSSPHVLGKALIFQFASLRFRCWNMLTFGLTGALFNRGASATARMPHSMEFTEQVQAAAREALGLASAQADELKLAANVLAKAKAETPAVEEYFQDVLQFDPTKAGKNKDGEVRVPRLLPKFREALTYAPGQQIQSAKGTWWGALNAVTAVLDHNHGRDEGTARRGAWIGGPSRMKRRALELALARAA